MQFNGPLMVALKATSDAVERVLDPLLKVPEGLEGKVVEAMRYAMFAGGKRLRPFLVIASSELFDVPKAQALRVAAAIECVHCYSLIHDDLPAMDNDDMRRGKLTTHNEYDEATAILAGDALLTLAFEILCDEATHPDACVRVALIKLLAQSSGHQGMVGGQMIDLSADDHELSESDIYRLQRMKTGALISFSAEAGCILAGADKKQRQSLHGYANDLGLAFQIADDLLDIEGIEEEVGKAVGKDEAAGKATIVSLIGLEKARIQAQMIADQAIEHLKDFGDKADLLRALAHFAVTRRK
jgi:farnesyl diphosphate synthase